MIGTFGRRGPRRGRRPGWIALCLAALVAVAGCGGEDDKPQPAETQLTPQPVGEQIRVRHLLIQYVGARDAAPEVKRSKASADSLVQSLRQRVEKGEEFAALAKEFSDDASAAEGGEIAPLAPGDAPPEFERVASALAPGELSQVFESPLGFHLILRLGTGAQRIAAQHILVRYHGATGAPDSLLRSRSEALQIIEKVLVDVQNPNVSFPVAASELSEDGATAPRGGYLGEFTHGQRVKAVEDAAFALEDGQISGVVESPYGFHIIKRVKPMDVRLRHILIAHAGSDGSVSVAGRGRDEALQRAMDVLFRARKGEDFAALAEEFSDDRGTAKSGGRLPLISRGQTVPQFEDAAFSLEPGQVSDIVETPFGFHIIKRLY